MTVRCKGELSLCTAETLRRELGLLEGLDHPALILNLAECMVPDVDGTPAILRSFKRFRDKRRRLIIVTGARSLEVVLGIPGIEKLIPSYPTEEAAALDLRGWWPPLPARSLVPARSPLDFHRLNYLHDGTDGAQCYHRRNPPKAG